ncbi:alanine--glyoxylate aminotransferase family protein [uncultured Clostridium sp.]|uniref:pyridoxal-phosphate-dependent aminotransferase family protein n=1 Tax=uncultured Clostridium sp. TaxID=59620 RepID=UPI0025F8ED56|nr:aminotransferase class V-fold PLP-dependent enzyme [uncultured Clostridium sp.]
MKETLFSVGPVMMDEEIKNIGGEQLPYFRTEEFSKINLENEKMLKEICYAEENSKVITLTASGTGAMEASILNCFNDKDKLLIIVGGGFGHRFAEICDIYELEYDIVRLDNGMTVTEEIMKNYEDKGYTALIVNAHETSTGVLYDLNMLGQFCKRNNMYFIVDAISSFLADEYYMEKWGIDLTIISSQKAIALPPGLSLVVLSNRIIKKINENKIKSLYFDFKIYLKNMERGQTPFTPAVGIILQLHEALIKIKKYGVQNSIQDIKKLAEYFRENIKELPFDIPSESLSNCLTPLKPKKNNAYDIYMYLKSNYGIVLCPNGGELRNSLVRVGHIGDLSIKDIDKLIRALNDMNRKGLI